MNVTQITTHSEDAKKRLLFQYQGKANIEGLLDSLGGQQIQDLEDILFDISGRLDINNSIGVQLDGIGKIVGQARNGQDDPTYRLFLKAKAGRNVSEGDINRVISIWKIITSGTVIRVDEFFPGEIELFSDVPLAPELEQIGFALMQDVVAAGVRVVATPVSPENAFGFEDSVGTLGFDTVFTSSTNTSTSAFKLIDSGASFVADGVVIDSEVIETPGNNTAVVTNVDSPIQLTLDADIFTSTPLDYYIVDGGGGGLSTVQV